MEIVNCHDKFFVEGGAFQSKYWAEVTLAVFRHADVLSIFLVFTNRLYSPINHEEITFVGSREESGCFLTLLEKNARKTYFARTILSKKIDRKPWDPLIIILLILASLTGLTHS